jgi:formamidase
LRIAVDTSLPLAREPGTGHNRWHPDIPPIARVRPGQEVTIETRDGADGQLTRASTHENVLGLDLGLSHPLTGPVFVEGAEPGDVLDVEIQSYESAGFGFTPIYPGFGFLADLFPKPFLAKWELDGGFARSSELPGVAIPAEPFAGVLGVAPSHDLMNEQRERERRLASLGFDLAAPDAPGAVPDLAAAGLRTIPPRENGGNLDIRQLVAGSRLLLPVHVAGALFSVGDLHFAQGDGEVCGSAIEIAGAITVRFGLLDHEASRFQFPRYSAPARVTPPSFVTTGLSVGEDGSAEWMDVRLAARRAVLELIDYLCDSRAISREAAYVLVSVAGDLRISQVVDVPHPLVSAAMRLDIFEG